MRRQFTTEGHHRRHRAQFTAHQRRTTGQFTQHTFSITRPSRARLSFRQHVRIITRRRNINTFLLFSIRMRLTLGIFSRTVTGGRRLQTFNKTITMKSRTVNIFKLVSNRHRHQNNDRRRAARGRRTHRRKRSSIRWNLIEDLTNTVSLNNQRVFRSKHIDTENVRFSQPFANGPHSCEILK